MRKINNVAGWILLAHVVAVPVIVLFGIWGAVVGVRVVQTMIVVFITSVVVYSITDIVK